MDETFLLSEALRLGQKYGFEVEFDLDAKVINFDVDIDENTPPELLDELERLERTLNTKEGYCHE